MGPGDIGGLLLAVAGVGTMFGGWYKTRIDAKKGEQESSREAVSTQFARQDAEIERQRVQIEKQDAKIDSMRREHRADMEAIRLRADAIEARSRAVFDYAFILRQHIAEGKGPPPPPWPARLLSTWKGDGA